MKETGTAHWLSPNISATNESGFFAIPGGQRNGIQKEFNNIGRGGYWWSATVNSPNNIGENAWNRLIWNDFSKVERNSVASEDGFSVRYIMDTNAPVSNFSLSRNFIIKGQSVQFIDNSSNNPTSWLWDFGDGTTSTEQNPTKTYNTFGTNIVSLKATNGIGNNTKTFSITVYESGNSTLVYEGRTYKTVIIDDKEWMAENLAYLPAVHPPTSESYTVPRYYVYGYIGSNLDTAKQQSNYTTYGVLYNWPAANAACPPGWHLPTDAEWTALKDYMIANEFNYDGTTTENKIAKSLAATTNWNASSEIGAIGNNLTLNNKSGLSALPGGYRNYDGTFANVGGGGYWWSSALGSSIYAWSRYLLYDLSYILDEGLGKQYGYSVRCVRD